MYRILYFLILFTLSPVSFATDWRIIPSNDNYWIKTTNQNKHELLLAYNANKPYFLLIIYADSPVPDRPIPIWLKIDKGQKEKSQMHFLQKFPERSIFKIEINSQLEKNYIARMIAGLEWLIYFDNSDKSRNAMKFSLTGFTMAFNNLLIANEAGSLEPATLLKNKKAKQLYCYLKADIIEQALLHRTKNKSYSETLHSIPKTEYLPIDKYLTDIIKQAYNIPKESIPKKSGTYKYKNYKRCLKNIDAQF